MTQSTDIPREAARPPRLLALCAGYGGLERALSAGLGGQVVAYAENDPHASRVFSAHHPGIPNLGDITAIDWRQVRELYRPDVIGAGWPCRNISNAGRRDGIHGQWSKVWKDVAAAVGDIRPRLVFLENVAALRSRGLDVVAEDLAALGYDARWTCLRAGDPAVGAPHNRDRWFAVAHPADADPHHLGRHWRTRHQPQPQGRPEPPHPRHEAPSPARGLRLLPTPKASDGPHGGPNQRDTGGRYYLPGQAVRLDPRWLATDGTDYGPAIRRWETVTGRKAPCPTEPGTRGNRRLAPAFVEWLMGLPAGWVTEVDGIPRAQQLKILGNGVVPQQAHHAYTQLLSTHLTSALDIRGAA
ncbi:DNA cytosine methyltransferase [Streptomyces virginiae]